MSTETLHQFGHIPFMAVTISFGVIISATIYNFSLYIYLKNRQYLYYSLAQLSSLLFLINLDALFIAPFDEIFGFKSILFFDISQLLMLIFSLLFLKMFFKSYNVFETDKLIKIILLLAVVDIMVTLIFSQGFFIRFIPIFIPILLVLSEAVRYVKKKDFPFYLVFMGWSMVLLVVTVEYFGFLSLIGITFPFLHIAISLESILLSLAIAYKFKLLEKEQAQQKMLMLQQSRLASMGEMITGIVHQWRQPLNVISFGLMNIKKHVKGEDKSLVTIEKLNKQVQYMSSTLEDFRNFYNPSKIKKEFNVSNVIHNSYTIVSSILQNKGIEFSLEIENDFTLYGHQNELEQVVLNIINNAKDAFSDVRVQQPKIEIKINMSTIIISDNAGGIDESYINRVFDSYFTTKKYGDGIGLYLSKLIIEREFNGKISVKSEVSGAKRGTIFIMNF